MLKNDTLFVLIKSLSRNEKRYFRLFCTREASGYNYLQLFDAIANQTSYDEKKIKERFRNEAFVKQLHVTKNYLQKMLLKSLRNFHTHLSKDAELKDMLRNIEILFHKELYTHCESELKKANSIARKYELQSGLVEIHAWKRKLHQVLHPQDYPAFLEIIGEQAQAIAQLQNTNAYWQLAANLSRALTGGETLPAEKVHLLEDAANATSLEAQVLHQYALYLRHLQEQDSAAAEKALYDLLDTFEAQPHRVLEDAGLYVASINNLVSYLLFNQKHREALTLIVRAKQMYEEWAITAEKKSLLKQVLRTYNIELEIYLNTGSVDEHPEFINSTEAFIVANKHKMPRDYLISFRLQLAAIHFLRRDYDRSSHWINQLLNTSYKEAETSILIQARMLNLMIHFERQNFFVMRYFVDSTRRFIRKNRVPAEYEKILLAFFSQISNTPLLEYKAKFAALHRKLFPPGKAALIPSELRHSIDYRAWVEEKLK